MSNQGRVTSDGGFAPAVSLCLCLGLGVLGAGCYDRNQIVEPSEVLTLEASPATIPAEGSRPRR